MRAVPSRHVLRPRLVAELAAAPVTVIEAGGGYGKSVLVAEAREELGHAAVEAVLEPHGSLRGALRRGARRAGLSDVAAALDSEPLAATLTAALAREPAPVMLVIDEAQHADPDAVRLLRELAVSLPAEHRLLIVGRRLDPELRAIAGAVRIDAGALAFTADEVAQLIDDPVTARAAHAATGGWPAACALAAARPQTVMTGAGLTGLVDEVLGVDNADLAVLGHLPLLSDAAAAACAGPDAFTRLRATGIPLRRRSTEWWELPDPVREDLMSRGPLPEAAGRAAAAVYAGGGELRTATSLLAHDGEGLAAQLATAHWTEVAELDLGELRVLTGALGDDVLGRHPGALLNVARVAERAADSEVREELLERAVTLAPPGPPRREAEAELAVTTAALRPGPEVEATARAVLDVAGPEEPIAQARARVALAWIAAWRGDPRSLHAAERDLEQAVALFRRARESAWAASALMALGYRVCFARGDLDRAAEHLFAALGLVPAPGAERAAMATFLATILAYTGRLDEAENALREAESIARSIGDQRALAYAEWTWAVLASLRGDRAVTLHRARAAERHFGPWFAHPTGAEFLTDATLALGRVGNAGAAREYAERATEHARSVGYPEIALLATGATEARFGDPERAERDLVAYAASDQPSARDEWQILLLRAHAAHRAGASTAADLLAEALAAAEALGHPELPQLHEPDLVAEAAQPAFAVRLLGGFQVTAQGRPVTSPPGRATTLAKLLAVRRETVPADEAIELLWPDADPDTGRARLRNLLNRLRGACGDLVERTDDGLRLSARADVDAARFEAGLETARSAAPAARAGVARNALAGYGGELLPDDRYADWTTLARERLRRGQLELIDGLVEDAVDRGDVDEAIRLLERAVEAEPLDEDRLLRAAELRLFQGRRGTARTLVERVLALRAELGIALDPRLRRLAESVGITTG
jgi:DNA-binding SARP family transcriptional activator